MARLVLEGIERHRDVFEFATVAELEQVVRAGRERSAGDHDAAIARLRKQLGTSTLFQTRSALFEAYYAAGQYPAALDETKWLARHRGRAYIELNGVQSGQAMNVADTRLAHLRAAESLVRLRRPDEAQQEVLVFLESWPLESLPDYLRLRVEAILPASKQ